MAYLVGSNDYQNFTVFMLPMESIRQLSLIYRKIVVIYPSREESSPNRHIVTLGLYTSLPQNIVINMADLWTKLFSDIFMCSMTILRRLAPDLEEARMTRIAVMIGTEVATRFTDPTMPPLERDSGTQTDDPSAHTSQGPMARTMEALRTLQRDRQGGKE